MDFPIEMYDLKNEKIPHNSFFHYFFRVSINRWIGESLLNIAMTLFKVLSSIFLEDFHNNCNKVQNCFYYNQKNLALMI